MQADIVKAEQAGDQEQVRQVQERLIRTEAAKLLAVHQVTSTNGRRSPGVDGRLWDTAARKLDAVRTLDPDHDQPQPARRVMIPKSSDRMRPIGVLTMHDRAMQALYLLALDPVAEVRADPHSYGFRKARATADAIARCEEIVADPERPWWILNADIEQCFDTISHEWLLTHVPLETEVLRGWLTAGYMDKGQVYSTDRGLPQGAIISPTLANLALNGLEAVLDECIQQQRRPRPLYLVRYADDFLVLSTSKRVLRRTVRPLLEDFLTVRGMRLSQKKTDLVHLKQGIEFLGCDLRIKKGDIRVAPAAGSVQKIAARVSALIQANPGITPSQVIQLLTPVIRSWANYYKHVSIREPFVDLDQRVAQILWTWAKEQQSGMFKRRHARRLFTTGPGSLRLLTDDEGNRLYCAQETPYVRHIPIEPHCNPYDPAWKKYLSDRQQAQKTKKVCQDDDEAIPEEPAHIV